MPDAVRVCGSCTETGPPILQAIRVHGDAIQVDGLMSEAAWGESNVATDFVQFEPNEGAAGSQDTEARVLYGDDALYVFLRAHDSAADSIASASSRGETSTRTPTSWAWSSIPTSTGARPSTSR